MACAVFRRTRSLSPSFELYLKALTDNFGLPPFSPKQVTSVSIREGVE